MNISRWLDVEVGTDDIDLVTLPSNLALVDLQNDEDFKLFVGDFGRGQDDSKLKMFKGTMQVADFVLPDLPLGVVGFYAHDTSPRATPLLAVAFSSCIYIYRDLKLFYKFYLPSVEMSTCETDIWKQLTDPKNQTQETVKKLIDNLRSIPYQYLTAQSQKLLELNAEQQIEHLEQITQLPANHTTEITCMASLRLNSVDAYSISCLVVATEDGQVLVLEPQTFSIIHQAKLCVAGKTPYQMVTTGLYHVDYRITVATREKSVCLLKREWKEGRVMFTTDDHIIAIEVTATDNSVLVICTDNTLTCFSRKGKKQWSIPLEHRPVAMTQLPIIHLGLTLTGVALASGHLHLYDGKTLVDTLFVRDVVSVMKFGQLGQEEHVFIIITRSGNLMLKILKRTADFNLHGSGLEYQPAPATQSKPWLIPKKSKLFLEQSLRERENAVAMHETFQRELNWLRLTAAKTLLEAYAKSDNSIATGNLESVRLSAEVEGLGPVFRVTLIVDNTSSEKAVVGLAILFHVHRTNYKVYNPYIKVPLISPASTLKFPTKVEEIFSPNEDPDVLFRAVTGQSGERSLIKVLLLKNGKASPVLAATVQMPPTDPMMMPYDKVQGEEAFGQS